MTFPRLRSRRGMSFSLALLKAMYWFSSSREGKAHWNFQQQRKRQKSLSAFLLFSGWRLIVGPKLGSDSLSKLQTQCSPLDGAMQILRKP